MYDGNMPQGFLLYEGLSRGCLDSCYYVAVPFRLGTEILSTGLYEALKDLGIPQNKSKSYGGRAKE